MAQRKYFPHIDGLRGIAVLLVLLFHVDISFLKGGFIGVDIFFVISGYLISTILIEKNDNNNFSFHDFYIRRIKRLMPSMLIVIIISLIMAFFFLPYYLFETSLKSSNAAVLSYSNILFYKQSGYFDSDAHLKPFLHTWSLSVEEQFYLIWPLLLFFILKLKTKKTRILIFIGIGILSLCFSEYFLSFNSSAAFYLTPFRVFEFIIGTLIYWVNKFELKASLKEIVTTLAVIGFVFITYMYDKNTPFPGINALIPCILSAILIHNTGQAKYVSSIYDNQIIRWFGKISYSLYLVHWPLIVIYKFQFSKELNYSDQILLILLSTFLGYIVNKFIEVPFREKDSKRESKKIVPYIFTTLGLVIIANLILIKHGETLFHTKDNKQYSLREINEGKELRFTFCNDVSLSDIELKKTIHEKQVLILGDSHAPDALNFLKLTYPNYDYRMLTEGGCPPMTKTDFQSIDQGGHTVEMKIKWFDLIDKYNTMDFKNYEYIVINVMFGWYKPEFLIHFIQELKKKTNAKIIVFGNYVVFNKDLVDIVAKEKNIPLQSIESIALYENELKNNAPNNYKYVSKKEILSNKKKSNEIVYFTNENEPMTYDSNHLSFGFAQLISDSIKAKNIRIFD